MNERAPMSGGRMQMLVQRHDNYSAETGKLTPEGEQHAREQAQAKAKEYLDANPDTHFFVIASDQMFDDGKSQVGDGREPVQVDTIDGQRAVETAEIVRSVIAEELSARGLKPEQLLGANEAAVDSSPTLREADIFENGFMQHLRELYPDDPKAQWTAFYQEVHDDKRDEYHAESPSHVAARMDYAIKNIELAAQFFHNDPDKAHSPLVAWIVGHGGGLDSYLNAYFGVPLAEVGFEYSGGFTLGADETGQVFADVKGDRYYYKGGEGITQPEGASV
ncbi:MAG: histidine phosphatase family protein [Candidatus Nomurabacteria bacterium]|jgi:broad specificity phosphatase PhoE|nr:histidine phosphatase family protein [Candidatus Nomurabacteria bacterium]